MPGFPAYEASPAGLIRRVARSRGATVGYVLRPTVGSHGYPVVNLRRDRRSYQRCVHAVITLTFLGPCPPGQEVNHRNARKTDCRLSNLEHVTHQENVDHAVALGLNPRGERQGTAKLTRREVRRIRRLCGRVPQRQIAAMFGVCQTSVSRINLGLSWADA